ncbi:MAG: response regulator [Asticcacaulis sp.]
MGDRLTRKGRAAEVLVIDDSRGDGMLTERAFRDGEFACKVTVVFTGEAALERLHDETRPLPDLILLDLQLPGLSGLDVLHALKHDARLRPIPVIVMSNGETSENVFRAYNLYVTAYIVKPLGIDAYREAVALIGSLFFGLASLPDAGLSGIGPDVAGVT